MDQRGIGQPGDADRQVIAFVDDVDDAIREGDVQFHFRMAFQEDRPQRCQVQDAEGHGGIDAQQAGGLGAAGQQQVIGFFQRCNYLLAAFQVEAAGFGQREPPGGPLHQARTQARFQFQYRA